MLAIIALFREILSQYLIIIASIDVTKVSQIIIYSVPSHIINGRTNHNNGRVTVVGIIHRKRSFFFEISSSFQNIFAIKNKTNVSIKTANHQKSGNLVVLPFILCFRSTFSLLSNTKL